MERSDWLANQREKSNLILEYRSKTVAFPIHISLTHLVYRRLNTFNVEFTRRLDFVSNLENESKTQIVIPNIRILNQNNNFE